MKIENVLEELWQMFQQGKFELRVLSIPSREPELVDFPAEIHSQVKTIYSEKKITKLFSHQAAALKLILQKKNVVIATPTASGKTLIYNASVLNELFTDSQSRALYLFPTKALSQDQREELLEINKISGEELALYTYDGDTPQTMRQAIRKKAQIVLTNPYMLHSGILPHHTNWAGFFENLKFIIIDELHYYTGVFGSHVANVLRRLKRVASFYGARPIFIMSSATINNPQELASNLIEEDIELINFSGAGQAEKKIVLITPPIVNKMLGIRRSYIAVTRDIASIILENDLQLIVFANSRLLTEVLVKYLKNDYEKTLDRKGQIRGYRGGYLPEQRREIEHGLRNGKIRAVVATNALELGIDIGSLDAALLAGYPGNISSTWQRMGRAGRRSGKSLGIVVLSSAPIDQYLSHHPEYFINQNPENGRINPNNLDILIDHIKCAAFELPFVAGERFGKEELSEVLNFLAENKLLYFKNGRWFWTAEGYPAETVSLTRVSSDNFLVTNLDNGGEIIAEVDFSYALGTLHPKAIYLLEGEQYVVEELDFENRKALVRKSNADYFTDAISYSKIEVLDVFDRREGPRHAVQWGDVHVFSQVVGFKKIKFFTFENVGFGDLQLPQQEFHTTAFWLTINKNFLSLLEVSRDEKIAALWGLAYLIRQLAPIFLLCSPRDLGLAIDDNLTHSVIQRLEVRRETLIVPTDQFEPNIYLYDNYPNGIGLSEQLFLIIDTVLEKMISAINSCPCKSGCPSCVGPHDKFNIKEIVAYLIKSFLNRVEN